jgi:hypothetical protein
MKLCAAGFTAAHSLIFLYLVIHENYILTFSVNTLIFLNLSGSEIFPKKQKYKDSNKKNHLGPTYPKQ